MATQGTVQRLRGIAARGFAAMASAALAAAPAEAANQDEIQVYDNAIEKPGEFGLDLHLNATPSGREFQFYPGEITNAHGVRVTPEFSYGIAKDLELGFYLDTQKDGDDTYYVAGTKYRLKWMPLQPDDNSGYFAGANIEYGIIVHRFSQSSETLELRLIDGYRSENWLVAFNPIFDWNLSNGIASGDPDLTAALKVTYKIMDGVRAGVEYYGELGKITHFSAWEQQDQRIYAVVDFDLKPFELNFGIGAGLTRASDALTIKTIWSVPVEEIFKRQ